jgi:signal transduction histidine kinase
LLDADPAATKELLEQLGRDVEQALAEMTQLAQRTYPPLLDAGGLATELRSAAASAGVRARIEVAAGRRYPPEVAWTVYLCWVEALERAGNEAQATITVREKEGTLAFEIGAQGDQPSPGLERLRDRVEALGGRLKIESERVSGSLPLSA